MARAVFHALCFPADGPPRKVRPRPGARVPERRSPSAGPGKKEVYRVLGTILLILLVILLVGALPTWPYSAGWGYYPTGGFGILLAVLIVLLVAGRI